MRWKGNIRWAIAYGMAAFSAASAATYGAEQASTAWKAVLAGGGLFLCAFVAVHCMAWAAEAWRRPARLWAGVIGLGGLVCFAVTLAMSTGMWASRADKVVATAAAAIDSGKALRAERDRLEVELAQLSRRPAGTITAEIETAKASPRFKATGGCTSDQITVRESREHCAMFQRLVGELAGAERAAAIGARLTVIGADLAGLPAVKSADAQAETFAELFSVSPGKVSASTAFATSLALELGALIATLAAEVLGDDRRAPARPVVRRARRVRRVLHEASRPLPAPVTPAALEAVPARVASVPAVVPFPPAAERVSRLGGARVGRVAHFLLAAVAPAIGSRLDAVDVLASYKVWCAARDLRPMPDDEFARSLAEACTKAGVECVRAGTTIVLMHAKLVA